MKDYHISMEKNQLKIKKYGAEVGKGRLKGPEHRWGKG